MKAAQERKSQKVILYGGKLKSYVLMNITKKYTRERLESSWSQSAHSMERALILISLFLAVTVLDITMSAVSGFTRKAAMPEN